MPLPSQTPASSPRNPLQSRTVLNFDPISIIIRTYDRPGLFPLASSLALHLFLGTHEVYDYLGRQRGARSGSAFPRTSWPKQGALGDVRQLLLPEKRTGEQSIEKNLQDGNLGGRAWLSSGDVGLRGGYQREFWIIRLDQLPHKVFRDRCRNESYKKPEFATNEYRFATNSQNVSEVWHRTYSVIPSSHQGFCNQYCLLPTISSSPKPSFPRLPIFRLVSETNNSNCYQSLFDHPDKQFNQRGLLPIQTLLTACNIATNAQHSNLLTTTMWFVRC